MEKKMVGILAGVAAVHVVFLAGLMASGGCRQPAILGTQTYNDGPAMEKVPPAQETLPPAVPQTEVAVPPAAQPAAPLALPGLASVPPAVRSAAPAPAAGGSVYKVVKGDSLSRIAYKHGLKTKELAAYNNLDMKSTLKIGQELKIPAGGTYAAPAPQTDNAGGKPAGTKAGKTPGKSAAKPAELPADGIYVVAAGDSLERIGRKFGVSARAIAKENNIALTKVLRIGEKLRIPARGAGKAAAPKPDGKKTPTQDRKTPVLSTDDLDPNLPLANGGAAQGGTEQPSALTNTESVSVPADMTAEDFCKHNNVKLDDLKRLNPDLPADGKLKGGSFLIVPRLQ